VILWFFVFSSWGLDDCFFFWACLVVQLWFLSSVFLGFKMVFLAGLVSYFSLLAWFCMSLYFFWVGGYLVFWSRLSICGFLVVHQLEDMTLRHLEEYLGSQLLHVEVLEIQEQYFQHYQL
jgi:hypothetical protein